MKTLCHIPLSIIFVSFFLLTVQNNLIAQEKSGNELYQEALYHMEGLGDYHEAIPIFENIVNQYSGDKPLAARALLMLGKCHEMLGRKEAEKSYKSIIDHYSDQREIVNEARSRLLALAERMNATNMTGVIARQVWTGSGVDVFGAPSPDGRYLSYVDWSNGDLAMRDLTTGENRRLTNKGSWSDSNEYAEYSIFSPDGLQLAYAWYNQNTNNYELRTINRDGTYIKTIYSDPEVNYVQPRGWTPDGKKILFVSRLQNRSTSIAFVDVDSGTVQKLKSFDSRYPNVHLSHDGRWITFGIRNDGKNYEIFLMDALGTNEAKLFESTSNDFIAGWTPDNEHILFTSDRTGSVSAWLQRVSEGRAEGKPFIVRQDLGRIRPLGFNSNGAFFYVLGGMRDVYIAGIDSLTGKLTSGPENATDRFQGTNFVPAWSPDGQSIAYISRRQTQEGVGANAIVIRALHNGDEKIIFPELNIPNNLNYAQLYWSADGNAITTVARDKTGRIGAYRIDIQTGKVEPIYQRDDWPFTSLNISADGRFMIVREPGNENTEKLVRYDLTTGVEQLLHQSPHIHTAAVSPDGRQLAIATLTEEDAKQMLNVPNSIRIVIQQLQGGESKQIYEVPMDHEIKSVTWTHDQKHILFTVQIDMEAMHPLDNQVWRIPVEGGIAIKTDLELNPRELNRAHFNPLTHQIAYTVVDDESLEIWAMDNFLPENK